MRLKSVNYPCVSMSFLATAHQAATMLVLLANFLLKPAKNKLTWRDFTSFSKLNSTDLYPFRFRYMYALHIQNLLQAY